jgi:hypothetical protein
MTALALGFAELTVLAASSGGSERPCHPPSSRHAATPRQGSWHCQRPLAPPAEHRPQRVPVQCAIKLIQHACPNYTSPCAKPAARSPALASVSPRIIRSNPTAEAEMCKGSPLGEVNRACGAIRDELPCAESFGARAARAITSRAGRGAAPKA